MEPQNLSHNPTVSVHANGVNTTKVENRISSEWTYGNVHVILWLGRIVITA